MPINQLSAKQLQQKIADSEDLFLLDVREPVEYNFAKIEGSTLIPLNQIPEKTKELQPDQLTVIICHHGVRSMQAASYLERCGFSQLFNLAGGIDSWSIECDTSVLRY